MDRQVWLEATSAVLETIESAFLGEGTSPIETLPSNSGGQHSAGGRKHSRRGTSDTMSDIDASGSPVKRRRESIDGSYADGEPSKPTAKSRKVSSALSRQFARSLSVSNGSAVEPLEIQADCDMADDYGVAESGISSPIPLSAVSSSSSLSSISPWPPTSRTSGMSLSDPMTGSISSAPQSTGATNRVFVFPSMNRSTKAREKNNADLGISREAPSKRMSWSGMETDSNDGGLGPNLSGHALGNSGTSCTSGVAERSAFVSLMTSLHSDCIITSEESANLAIQQWAINQAHVSGEQPVALKDMLEVRLSRLRELLPAVLDQIAGDHRRASLLVGDQIREFYRAGCEIADIGEWMERHNFNLLAAFFPSLGQVLMQLHSLIGVARVVEDMYTVLQWTPEFSLSLADMSVEYEELIASKRLLYRDAISQDGLQWKTMGLPVDPQVFMRVRRWMESTSEICLVRLTRICERKANSASAYEKDDVSTDSLISSSSQIMHSLALCANMCGSGFPGLASHALFVVSECTLWICNRFKLSPGSKGTSAGGYRGRQLVSRAMRQIQACEGILKLLSYLKVMLGSAESSLFDIPMRSDHVVACSAALQNLASSVVEVSWLLAETLAAFRADGQMAKPSGVLLLFADFVLKFTKRVVDFGGFRDVSAPNARLGQQLRRIHVCVQSLSVVCQ
ncbi:hypothetical protein GGI15_002818 [Coemansia interrupta]|uniref:Uncharacterized protein n=1 Tax=Coemansia interrupta TaxID=1126814 RepID=A0A9W8HG36_9FUNG|nr:hypothetical protein GGI15_002818 [Coemansia interrupta]